MGFDFRTVYTRIPFLAASKVRVFQAFVLLDMGLADCDVTGNESCGIVAPPNVISTSYGQGKSRPSFGLLVLL